VEKTLVVIREATWGANKLSPELWLFVGSEVIGDPNLTADFVLLERYDVGTAIPQSTI
jgi:hypothetical protein